MYTTIQEAHEIFRGISENKMFFILEEIGGKVMMGTASDLVNLINADGDNVRHVPVDENDVEAWAIIEEAFNYYV